MSRAFVKEHDLDYLEDVADRPVSDHPNDVTEAGLKQIEAALEAAGEAYAKAQAAADRSGLAAQLGTFATGPRDGRARAWSRPRPTLQKFGSAPR